MPAISSIARVFSCNNSVKAGQKKITLRDFSQQFLVRAKIPVKDM